MGRSPKLLALGAAFALALSACASGGSSAADSDSGSDEENNNSESTSTSGGSVLADVIANDVVTCGTRDALPGFAVLQADGTHEGFDNDFCRAIAAAVLGDAEKVEFKDLETDDRFTALQSGEVDVLVRNTTWTASRDGSEGATFLAPNFYDGQGMMVAVESNFNSLEDMDGTTVCVASGTTTEGNVSSEFERLGLTVDVLSFENTDLIQEAFQAGRCDGWSSDVSQLAGLRTSFLNGEDSLKILPGVFSKEPLAPAVRDGDSEWAQVVNWAVFATIQAEEFGIDSSNVDGMLESDNPLIQTFLGVEVDGTALDPGLGLPVDANYQVVKQVGNYGEIYEQHIKPLGLERGQNSQWQDGGLLYAPPYR